ncbi:MAG: glycerophosphodiester phosphodiesterase family protein, partial [Gemmatimonadales bacterium]
PERFREVEDGDSLVREWPVYDFTLEEVKSLDAGSWFSPEFRDSRVPSLREVIELARGRAGIYPETKSPEVYASLGFSMERLLVTELERHGLDRRGADPLTPVVVQSFSAASLRILRWELKSDLPLTLLVHPGNADEWTKGSGLERLSEFASGIGPFKNLVEEDPAMVERAHAVGLSVTPWTFGSQSTSGHIELRAEMARYVCVLGVDGLFTNNPDLFPRRESCE